MAAVVALDAAALASAPNQLLADAVDRDMLRAALLCAALAGSDAASGAEAAGLGAAALLIDLRTGDLSALLMGVAKGAHWGWHAVGGAAARSSTRRAAARRPRPAAARRLRPQQRMQPCMLQLAPAPAARALPHARQCPHARRQPTPPSPQHAPPMRRPPSRQAP